MTVVFLVIASALIFEYINGFHDTANSIATVVGTKVLTPRQAIVLAATTNLLGAFTGIAVAKTISSGLVGAEFVTQGTLVCALFAGIVWNLLTWWLGLPSSSTHALVGGLVGSVLAVGLFLHQENRLVDKNKKPLESVWKTIIWDSPKDKSSKKLVDPTPATLAALAQEPLYDGTHVVKVGDTNVTVVTYEGRTREVAETKIKDGDRVGVLPKVIIPMVFSPVVGFVGGFFVMGVLFVLFRWARPVMVNRLFGKLQIVSAGYMGWSHGMNDATKTMGIITLALVAATGDGQLAHMPWLQVSPNADPTHLSPIAHAISWLPNWLQFGYMPDPVDTRSPGVPPWVVFICALTMAAGTAAGGWKIIKTMGHKMVKLQPVNGFAAETTAATVLYITGTLGMPVSTTHAITTSIMGVGCAKRFSALKLGVVERILWAWVLTLPATGGLAFGLVYLLAKVGVLAP